MVQCHDRAAPIKRTAIERQVNVHIIFLFFLLLALSLGSTIGSSIRTVRYRNFGHAETLFTFFTVVLLQPTMVFGGI